jgi:SIR2-like domain
MPQTIEAQRQPAMLTEDDWKMLLERIQNQKCTPFLGAESTGHLMPSRSAIAKRWAAEVDFPLEDSSDLARVAQFIATKRDPLEPRDKLVKEIEKIPTPDFKSADEPHGILASLPLPIFITTDYHNFMFAALKSQLKDAQQEICRWNDLVKDEPSVFDSDFKLTVANPVVFHLYGRAGVRESLVLTEDDYLEFLVETSKEAKRIPPRVQEAFTKTSLLFLGYRLTDLEFRVLLRTLAGYLERSMTRGHVSAQLVHVGDEPQTVEQLARLSKVQEYLRDYCEGFHITTYWGTTRDFLVELKQRWDAFAK